MLCSNFILFDLQAEKICNLLFGLWVGDDLLV